MRKLIIAAIALSMGVAGGAGAHPTNILFDSRGECEAAYAASSKLDRQRLVDLGFVENVGAAQKTFRDTFRCEYDEQEDGWFIVFLGFPQ